MASSPETSDTVWPLRPWVLAILGGLTALAIQQLVDLVDRDWAGEQRLLTASIIFLGVSAVSFGLAWQRGWLFAAIRISLFCGIIAGEFLIWNNVPNQVIGTEGWHVFCGVFTAACLLTLFQAAQDGWTGWPARLAPSGLIAWRREAILYSEVHGHLWTNALLLALSGAFTLLCISIAYLMAEMFWLVKLDFLKEALRQEWFQALMTGAPFGAALGLLRDRRGIITALQRVAMLVLRVLAPVVAVAIFIFLAALPFTGLAPLWDTGGTTPIMLVGAALALFLVNAVVGDRAADESRSIVRNSSAAALGLFLLPMIGIAAFSSGLRIQQYGLSPDRLWALTFIIVASIAAIAYAVAILGTRGWFARLRRTNLHLIFLIAGITLLLSTPLLSFDRLSTAHQLARLSGGQVSAEAFDYKGLWFDFGPPGKAAIEQLAARSSDARIRRYAKAAKALSSRWDEPPNAQASETGQMLDKRLTLLPRAFPLDDGTRNRLVRFNACNSNVAVPCTVHHVPGQDYMVVVAAPTPKCDRCRAQISIILRDKADKTGWSRDNRYVSSEKDLDAQVAAIRAGRVEMRPVQQRQLFIDGKPVGDVIPLANAAVP